MLFQNQEPVVLPLTLWGCKGNVKLSVERQQNHYSSRLFPSPKRFLLNLRNRAELSRWSVAAL